MRSMFVEVLWSQWFEFVHQLAERVRFPANLGDRHTRTSFLADVLKVSKIRQNALWSDHVVTGSVRLKASSLWIVVGVDLVCDFVRCSELESVCRGRSALLKSEHQIVIVIDTRSIQFAIKIRGEWFTKLGVWQQNHPVRCVLPGKGRRTNARSPTLIVFEMNEMTQLIKSNYQLAN